MKRILIGLLITIISFLLLRYNEWLVSQVGTWSFAEKWLRTEGGTRLAYKLLSIVGLIIGLLVITNLHGYLLEWLVRLLIPTF